MRVTRIDTNQRGLRLLFSDQHGGVAQDLGRRAIRVQNDAKLNATGRTVPNASNPEQRGPRVDTGRLRSSIAWELRLVDGQVVARVGTDVEYGLHLETGLKNGRTYPFLKPALAAARG